MWVKDGRLGFWWYPCTRVFYLRIIFLIGALFCHFYAMPYGFMLLAGTSSLLDLWDGYLARKFGHETSLGAVLDFGLDLVTHTVLWVLSGFPFMPIFIGLEWGAGVSVLWFSRRQSLHWKTALMDAPVGLVQRYFANRQRNGLSGFAGVSHFGFRMAWYLGYGETLAANVFLPGIILFEVVTAYMIWVPLRLQWGFYRKE